jgi:DNA-binding NarL/FixJ family response regulator
MKTLLVDDHALVLEGLKHFLDSQGIEVVGTARSGVEALMQYEMHEAEIDVVLMDIQMEGCDGIEATRMIKKEYPEAMVVMLTASADEETLLAAMQAGAEGYLLKDMEPESFIRQLTGMTAGEMPLAPQLAERLLYEFGHRGEQNMPEVHPSEEPAEGNLPVKELSERQREVLQFLIRGLTYREIADRLELKEVTVKYHVKEILSKMGLPNRTKLIAYTLREGMPGEGKEPS